MWRNIKFPKYVMYRNLKFLHMTNFSPHIFGIDEKYQVGYDSCLDLDWGVKVWRLVTVNSVTLVICRQFGDLRL